MLQRLVQGRVPPKHHSVFPKPEGGIFVEHCFTRDGFDGPFTLFYHRQAPTDQVEVRPSARGWSAPLKADEGPVRRRHFKSQSLPVGGCPADARVPLMVNDQVVLHAARPDRSDDVWLVNADGDDLYYLHTGAAVVWSPFGRLDVGPGDYLLVPRAVPHRFELQGTGHHLFIIEGSRITLPSPYVNGAGQLRMEAPYNHRDFEAPTLPVDAAGFGLPLEGPHIQLVKRGGVFTEHVYRRCPMDVVGWDGAVYPMRLNIASFQPKVSSYHLPPNLHGTFQGEAFVVCSFVPRMVDFGPGAIPCPYPHSNVHCDEVLFYHSGHFTSRRGIEAGSLSYHPYGLPHGPQPGAYEGSIGSTRTEECAVMVDTFKPLYPTTRALGLEDGGYQQSWVR